MQNRARCWQLGMVLAVTLCSLRGLADEAKPVPAPAGAVVLFDGSSTAAWTKDWKRLEDGSMEVSGGSNATRQSFRGDFQLHVEFWLPLMAERKSQSRANSGVFPHGRLFEIQVLDSYLNETYATGGCGAIYGQKDPDHFDQAVRKPEQWQSYDIHFTAAKFEAGKLKAKARVTVLWNGVKVHDDVEINDAPPDDKPEPILLQDHGCKVRYRNVWLLAKETK